MSAPNRQPATPTEQSQLQRDRAELRELDAELGLAVIPIELRARLSSAFKAMDALLLAEWHAAPKNDQPPVVDAALQLWRTERRRIRRRLPQDGAD